MTLGRPDQLINSTEFVYSVADSAQLLFIRH